MASGKAARTYWPFAPKISGLNTDTNLLKIVAMVTMMIDHCGKMFFPQHNFLRIIGRIAFPIYAYCIAAGCVYSKNRLKYLMRIVLMGLISQPLYVNALAHTNTRMYAIQFSQNPIGAVVNYYVESWSHPSIMLTLALGLLVIWSIRERQLAGTVALSLFIWKIQNSVDYGWRGVALIVLFYLFIEKWWLSLPVMAAYMTWWGMSYSTYRLFGLHFGTQFFAVMALPLIYIHTHSRLKVNKWVFYLFYPAHLIVIILILYARRLAGA